MKLLAAWNINIDDEFREYLNLLASVSVLFLLTAIAINRYQHYNTRAEITEIYSQLTVYKIFVHEYYGAINRLPNEEVLRREFVNVDNDIFNGFTHIQVSDISFNGSAITLHFSDSHPELDGTRFTFRPVVSEDTGTVHWLCGYAKSPGSAETGAPGTTIPEKFLVNICRE